MIERNVSWPGWEVTGVIGRGSYGAVYRIQRQIFDEVEQAALKVISIPQSPADVEELISEGYDKATITQRFEGYLKDIIHEYALMAKLKGHTNVVYCDDVRYVQHEGDLGWDIYIKMELLTPITRAFQDAADDGAIVRLGIDICNALELCKKRNIVHRDIKPQNIFVSEDGDFKLGDFGVAKVSEKTTGGTRIGTYKYMAPEVYHSKPYGAAADIYSLGLVLYWLLNERRHPFLPLPPEVPSSGMEEQARQRRLMGEALPAPKHGSEALKAVVLKACSYDPADRYTDAAEMRKALERVAAAQKEPDAPVEPAPTPVQPQQNQQEKSAEADHTTGKFDSQPVIETEADTETEESTVGGFNAVPSVKQPTPEPASVTPAAADEPEEELDHTVGAYPGFNGTKTPQEAPVKEPATTAESNADAALQKKHPIKKKWWLLAVAVVLAVVLFVAFKPQPVANEPQPVVTEPQSTITNVEVYSGRATVTESDADELVVEVNAPITDVYIWDQSRQKLESNDFKIEQEGDVVTLTKLSTAQDGAYTLHVYYRGSHAIVCFECK